MAKRTIGYYKDASKAPSNPLIVSTYIMFKNWNKPTLETAEPLICLDFGSDERSTLTVDEALRLMGAIGDALDDLPTVIEHEVTVQARQVAMIQKRNAAQVTQEVK